MANNNLGALMRKKEVERNIYGGLEDIERQNQLGVLIRPDAESKLQNMIKNESTGEYLTIGGGRSLTPTEFDPDWRAKRAREEANIRAYNRALQEEGQRMMSSGDDLMQMAILAKRSPEQARIAAQRFLQANPQFANEPGFSVEELTAGGSDSTLSEILQLRAKQAYAEQERQAAMQEKPSDRLAREKFEWEKSRAQDSPVKISPTIQKEVFEADELAQASQNVKSILGEAIKLNDKAYSGYGAKGRAIARSNLPGESPEADATIQLDNMMTGQALESLKALFGGMPTEGERKILLEMQASADKTPAQRKDIIERASQAADRRLKFNQSKAQALRAGGYFESGYSPIQDSAAPAEMPQLPSPQSATGRTVRDTSTGIRYKSDGSRWVRVE